MNRRVKELTSTSFRACGPRWACRTLTPIPLLPRVLIKPTLLVLAAGLGSRYGGLKQMEPFGPHGEVLLDYSVYDAWRAGFGKVVFVIRSDIEAAFRELLGARCERRLPVAYAFQELDKLPPGFTPPPGRTKPWGTTHAILMAADLIREPFAAINADDFYGASAFRVIAGHLASGGPDYAMAGFILRQTLSEFGSVARGVCRADASGYLQSIVEMTKVERDGDGAKNTGADGQVTRLTGDEAVSMNFWGFTPAVFPQLENFFRQFLQRSGAEAKSECYIPSTVNELIQAGQARVKVLRATDRWFGVTYQEDRPSTVQNLRQLIAAGAYPESLYDNL